MSVDPVLLHGEVQRCERIVVTTPRPGRGPIWWFACSVLLLTGTKPLGLAAQVRFVVDPKSSLAWWQIRPHMNHLWATTCPQERSWRPGDMYSAEFIPKFDLGPDTVAPLYPRATAKAVCAEAVRGEVEADTTNWRGVRGLVLVRADALVTGLKQRDEHARSRIMETQAYPDIRFQIDSLSNVQRGDTLRADAFGVFELHGAKTAMVVPIKFWREPLGLRVTGQFAFAAIDLIEVYHMSPYPLHLGVYMHIWHTVHLGIDAILVPPSG